MTLYCWSFKKGREAKHVYFVDDLDALRKVPADVPADYEQYLGVPICDVPAPDGSDSSYADYFSCKAWSRHARIWA